MAPYSELHRRPQRRGPHAFPCEFRRPSHTFRGPIRSATEGPSKVPHVDAPPMRFVALLNGGARLPMGPERCAHNCLWLGPSRG
eukprot:7238338-Pyramimonas_sp.AAC.1